MKTKVKYTDGNLEFDMRKYMKAHQLKSFYIVMTMSLMRRMIYRNLSFIDFMTLLREFSNFKAGLQLCGFKGVRNLYNKFGLSIDDVNHYDELINKYCTLTKSSYEYKINIVAEWLEIQSHLNGIINLQALRAVSAMEEKGFKESLLLRKRIFDAQLYELEHPEEFSLMAEDEWYPDDSNRAIKRNNELEMVQEIPATNNKKLVVVKIKGRIKYIVVDESVDILRAPEIYDKIVREELGLSINITTDRLTRAIALHQLLEQGKTAKELSIEYGISLSMIYADNRLIKKITYHKGEQ